MTDESLVSKKWSNSKGYWLVCDCGRAELLPYTDETKTRVWITTAKGWSSPPIRCPECSTKIQPEEPTDER